MLFLSCTMISSVDLAHYGVSRAKDWVLGKITAIILTVKHQKADKKVCKHSKHVLFQPYHIDNSKTRAQTV